MNTTVRYTTIGSPVGPLLLAGTRSSLCALQFAHGRKPVFPNEGWKKDDDELAKVVAQLDEYFAGARRTFDVQLEPSGTEFQRAVWNELCRIPYGSTISYAELARRIGNPRAVRAVGLANGANPIAIVVPCHRVIGANGTLTGYGGGLAAKRYLLDLEQRVVGGGTRDLFAGRRVGMRA
jgi:methylated-DNA-[protein]-cysteine S-methyltransferase